MTSMKVSLEDDSSTTITPLRKPNREAMAEEPRGQGGWKSSSRSEIDRDAGEREERVGG